MSTVKTNNVQIGQSVTATNNGTWYQPATPDGTVRLGVGNAGATTADVITASSTGVTIPSVSSNNTFGFKNRIINGGMVIDQRNAGASVTPAGASYLVDRWAFNTTQASKFSFQQNAGSVTPPSGFTNYLGATVVSAYSVAAGDVLFLTQNIEGYNCSDLAWGTASAKTVTLSFWVYSSLTGTFGGSIRNNAGTRSYPFSYSISSPNTWTYASIVIPGDTTGSWLGTNNSCIETKFSLGAGSTYSASAGVWAAGNYISATGATSVVGTNGATFYITGVQLEVGSRATSFDFRSYGQELALCQRYYQKSDGQINDYPSFHYGNNAFTAIVLPVAMRSAPTVTTIGLGSSYYEAGSTYTITSNNPVANSTQTIRINVGVSGGTSGYAGTFYPVYQASAEL